MKCARFNNRDIHIHTYSREHLQFLFDEARKDRITCKHCGLPLRLKLSIHEEPHFFHRENGDFSQCEAACLNEKTEQSRQNDYTESGVFRLPKGKAIGEEKKTDADFWTPPREASIHSPFSPAEETAPEPVFPNVPLNEKQLAAVTAPKNPFSFWPAREAEKHGY
ncbi:hypothetical protein RSC3_01289 [Bacillus paralicheniformis]|nr:hypothetical protein RSC3_01289 [Bacillus paralicheniformis]